MTMPTIYDEQGNPIDPQQPNEDRDDYLVRVSRRDIRQLEANSKTVDDERAARLAAERRAAFAEAGIPLSSDDERVKFFVEGYNGDLTAEAVKAKATAVGLTVPGATPTPEPTPPTQPPDTELEPGEAGFQRERQGLAQGAPGDEAPPADPYVEAQEVFDQAIKDGRQWKQAAGAAFNSLANAANRGDQRVIIPSRSVQAIGGGD